MFCLRVSINHLLFLISISIKYFVSTNFKGNKNLDILNLVHTTRFWYNLHQVDAQNQKIGKPNNLKVLGARHPKDLNRIAKIGYGHLCMREKNLSFDNNYTI